MSDLGQTLKLARNQAGISLEELARRTSYSRGYLSNVENGRRQATPDVIRAYERALGEDVNRRQALIISLASLATSTPLGDAAVSIAKEVSESRSGLLTELQTSHATDRAIARLVADDTASLAALAKWSRRGRAVLRVNATGILAKIGSPLVDSDAVAALRADSEVRTLYLTAVLARVLSLPWDHAADLAVGREGLHDAGLSAVIGELTNPYDTGARWCSVVMLYRSKPDHPAEVTDALIGALKTEQDRENVRAIGGVLAGISPLTM